MPKRRSTRGRTSKKRTNRKSSPIRKQPVRKVAAKYKAKEYEPSCEVAKKHYNKVSKLLKKSSSKKDLCQSIENMIPKECLKDLKVVRYLGGGVFGKILSLCKDRWECKAMKIMVEDPESDFVTADEEIKLQKYAAKHGMAPKIDRLCKRGNARFIVMDKVDGILNNFLSIKKQNWELDALVDEVQRLMKLLCKHKMTHGDLHWGNVGYTLEFEGDMSGRDSEYKPSKGGSRKKRTRLYAKLTFIDFGQAQIGKCNPRLDLLQLLRTAHVSYVDVANKSNMKYLHKKLYEIYKKKYNSKLKYDQKAIEKEFDMLRESYEKMFD